MRVPAPVKIGVVALVIWFLTRRKLASDLQVTLSKVGFQGNLLNPVINLTFDLYNPTDFTSTVSNIAGSLFLNGNVKIADVVGNNPVVIQSHQHNEMIITLDAIFTGISQTILQLIQNANNTSFSFKGSMTVDSIPGIPLTLDYTTNG